MATTTTPVIDDDIFAEADSFKKRGNWTEERREILKNVTWEEYVAECKRICAEHPERFSTPEELDAKLARIQQERAAKRRAELVGA